MEAELDLDSKRHFADLVKSLNLNKSQEEELKRTLGAHRDSNLSATLAKLRGRQGRQEEREMSEQELSLLSDDEREEAVRKMKAMAEADRLSEDWALMAALKEHEKVSNIFTFYYTQKTK